MTRIKTYLAQEIKKQAINIFEIDEHLEDISKALEKRLKNDFMEYGLLLRHFYVATIKKPESDQLYQKYRELHFRKYADIEDARIRQEVGIIDQQTASQRIEMEAQSLAKKRSIEGYTYQEEFGFDTKKGIEDNKSRTNHFCDKCGIELMPDAVFCHNCGADQSGGVTCKNCGFAFVREGQYCPLCGTKR